MLSAESPDWLLIAAECVGWGSQASSAIVSACVGIVSCPAATASWLSSSNRHCLTGLAAAELVITPRVTAARTQLGTERFELPDVFIFRPIRKTHSSLGRVSSVRAKGTRFPMRNRLRNGGARKSGAMGLRAVKLGYGQADLKRASVSDLSRVDGFDSSAG